MKKVLKFLCLLIIAALIAILVLKNGARAASVSANFSSDSIEVGDNVTLTVHFDSDITSCSGTYTCSGGELTTAGMGRVLMYQNADGSDTATFTLSATTAGQTEINITLDNVTFKDDGPSGETFTGSASINISGGEQEPSIAIGIDHSSMDVGATAHIYISSIYPEDDSVTYSIDNSEVASVDSEGNVLALQEGGATITATTGSGATDTQMITVYGGAQPPVDEFSVNPSTINTTVGSNTNVGISGGTLDYNRISTSNASVASFVPYGENVLIVHAEGPGDATITVGKSGSDATATISVHVEGEEPPGPEAQTPELNPTSVTLNAGGESASITSNIPVTWTSSNANVVAIAANSSDTQAAIISNYAGTAIITATAKDGGKTATVSVTVKANDEQAAPTITPSSNIKMEVGKSVFLSANQSVTWSSSNSAVATVDGDGLVIAKSAGETKITAKNKSGKTSSITVTVVQASSGNGGGSTPDSVDPNQGSETTNTFAISPTKTQTVNIGDTIQIKVTKGTASSWRSSKPAVATVDNNGKVTANSPGTTIITAVPSDGSVAQVKVRVKDENGEVPDPGSESNTDVPSTGEASTELLLVLGVLTCVIAMFIFRKKTK